MAVDVGSAVGYLDLDISGFLAGLKSAQSEADSASKSIASKIGSNLNGVGKSLTSVGTTLTKNVTVPLLAVGAAGLKVATDFEKGMSEVKAISGATGEQFDALKEKAIELGGSTAFSANEVAAAMTEMAKAGWSSQQIIDGMGGVLDAAAASGEGLAAVSTIVADAITGFGMEAKESTRVADLLTQAANSGTIGINDLGESFKYIAPVAGSMGLSIEDVTTALAAMSKAGIKGSQAGTSLRGMLTRMVKPTDDVAVAMDELGIVLTNQDGSFKSLDTIVGEMRGSFEGLTDEQKTYYAAVLAGQEGVSGLLSLLNLTEEEYNEIAESMDNATGVAAQTAAVMQDNLQSKVEQLLGSLESLAIKLADFVIPYLQQFVVWLTNLVDKFTALDPETQKTILKFAGLVAAAGPVITVIGKITTAAGGLFTAFGKLSGGFKAVAAGGKAGTGALAKLGGAMAGITAPMLAVIAVIAVLAAAFTSLWKNNEEFRNKVTAIWDQVKTTFNNFAQGIVDRLNSLGFNFTSITEVLKAVWEGFCNFLAPIFTGVFQLIADKFQVICDVILGIVDVFIAVFKGDWQGAWDAIKGIFESIWNYIVALFTNVTNTLKSILDVVCGWFGTTWSDTWNSIKTFFVNVWNSIVTWFQTTLTNIQTFFTNIWTSVSTFFTNTWTNISTFFTNVWNGIVSFVTTTLNNISTTFSNIWNGITSFLSTAWETIKNVVQVGIMFVVSLIDAAVQLITLPFRFIWENCKEIITSAWEAIKSAVSTALTAIQTTISTVWNAVKTFFTTIWTSISTFVTTIWNSIKTNITNALNAIKATVTTVWNAVKTTITNVFNSIKTTISTVLTTISTTISNVWNTIKTTVTNVVNGIKTTISNVWNSISTTVSSVVNTVKTTISNVFNSIKTTATSVWNGIKSAITVPFDAAKTAVSNAVNSVKTTISNGFNAAKTTVTNVFNSIKTGISNALNAAKTTVSTAIDKIKGFFNFSWSLPKLKMPHFSITGSFSLNPPSVPKLSISWYKKAMNNGMILDSATIFGYDQKTGKFLGGGEAGSETVVGTNNLLSMIKHAVNEAIAPLIAAGREIAKASADLGYVTYNGFTKLKESVNKQNGSNQNDGGGDTFNFYSPRAIDEIEAAKQLKKTKRELAEGF